MFVLLTFPNSSSNTTVAPFIGRPSGVMEKPERTAWLVGSGTGFTTDLFDLESAWRLPCGSLANLSLFNFIEKADDVIRRISIVMQASERQKMHMNEPVLGDLLILVC